MRRLSGHIELALTPSQANFVPSWAIHGLSSITRTSMGRLVTGGRVYFSTMLLQTLILKELVICQFWMSSRWRCPWVVAHKEIALHSGSDRSKMTLPECPSAMRWLNFSFVISSHLLPPFSPSLLTQPPVQDKLQMNHFPSHSHSLPLSPFLSICSLLSLYFRQWQSTLSCSSMAPVCSRTFLVLFLLISANISLTFLLPFSWMFGTTMTHLPTHPRHQSTYYQIQLQTIGTQMYLSCLLIEDGIRTLFPHQSIQCVFSSLLSCVHVHFIIISSTRHLHLWTHCPPHAPVSYHPCSSLNLILDDKSTSQLPP